MKFFRWFFVCSLLVVAVVMLLPITRAQDVEQPVPENPPPRIDVAKTVAIEAPVKDLLASSAVAAGEELLAADEADSTKAEVTVPESTPLQAKKRIEQPTKAVIAAAVLAAGRPQAAKPIADVRKNDI